MTLTARRTSPSGALTEIAADRIGERPDDGTFTWVDIRDPVPADLDTLRQRLTLPPIVLEDIGPEATTVTFRQHGDEAFVVFYAFGHRDGEVRRYRVGIYVGHDYVVSVRDAAVPELDALEDRWRQDVADIGLDRPATLLYSLLDVMVDTYGPAIEDLDDGVEAIEDRIVDGRADGIQRDIVDLRRSLLVTRRVLMAERDALSRVFHKEHPLIDEHYQPYFQDLYEQVNRAAEAADSAREMLSSTFGSYMSEVSNDLNITVRRLTAWTIILTTVTFVAGVYGMNFTDMPELGWRYGYIYALSLMAVLAGGLWLAFRRTRWL